MRYGSQVARRALGLALVGLFCCFGCAPAQVPLDDGTAEAHAPLVLPTSTPSFRLAPFRAATPPPPTTTPTRPPLPRMEPLVWIGGEGSLTVLSAQGWQTFDFPGIVRDIAIDAQGNAILAPGLRICDGRRLRDLLPRAPGGEQDAVAIDPQGRIWVGYYGGIAVLDGGQWRAAPIEAPGVDGRARMVRDLAIDSRGMVWVATAGGLARYDGLSWHHFAEDPVVGSAAINCLLVDRQHRVWVAHEEGLSVLRGGAWEHFAADRVGFVRGMAADRAGRILAGSLYHGLSFFDGWGWEPLANLRTGLPNDRVAALALDELGRIWAGTRHGLSVHEGGQWLTYQEANSGLGDDQISALAMGSGALSALPPVGPLRYSRLVGQVTLHQQPLGGVRVVLCSELSLAQGFDETPCENAPFSRLTRTADDGRYAFEQIPLGHYAVAAEIEPGRWMTRTRVLTSVRYRVKAGETAVAETIEGDE